MASIGFTGTRCGMSVRQQHALRELLDDTLGLFGFHAHHGCCIGADAEFHEECRIPRGGPVTIVGHPGPEWPDGKTCADVECDEMRPRRPYFVRDQDIVDAVQIMIAAPLQNESQRRGGTWATIRMAMKAHRAGKLRELYVIGRDGSLLDWRKW